jgi:hypothetical protein
MLFYVVSILGGSLLCIMLYSGWSEYIMWMAWKLPHDILNLIINKKNNASVKAACLVVMCFECRIDCCALKIISSDPLINSRWSREHSSTRLDRERRTWSLTVVLGYTGTVLFTVEYNCSCSNELSFHARVGVAFFRAVPQSLNNHVDVHFWR